MLKKLLIELLRDSKQSDRKLAKKLGVSQPTITRNRSKLEHDGIIRSYTVIPDWKKIGCEILVITFVKMHPEVVSEELFKRLRVYSMKFPNVFFASRGQGLGMTGMIMSLHKDYRDYALKISQFRSDWSQYLEDLQSFIMVTDEGVIKDFSFKYFDETCYDKPLKSS
ncbi:MAG: winged helix-turn-helix transcriptional regulator [Candidatus Bathyarchaeota archaeon]|nr:MAG: winged helix-turn-helix transcriptional regulator [Candidatus Bathyarchaeota archaeon]